MINICACGNNSVCQLDTDSSAEVKYVITVSTIQVSDGVSYCRIFGSAGGDRVIILAGYHK